jgi:hypothetical protein
MTVVRVKTTSGWLDVTRAGPQGVQGVGGPAGPPGGTDYGYKGQIAPDASISAAAPLDQWAPLTTPYTPLTWGPAGAFTLNSDVGGAPGSVTIRDPGLYLVVAQVNSYATWASASKLWLALFRGTSAGLAPPSGSRIATDYDDVAAGSVLSRIVTTVDYFNSNDRLWVAYYGVANAGTIYCTQLRIVRVAPGALLSKAMRTGFSWAVSGPLTAGMVIPSFFVPVAAGQASNLLGVRAKIASGTSVVAQLARNGANVGTAPTITTTKATTTFGTPVALTDGDEVGIALSSPVANPANLSLTAIMEHFI